MAEQTNKPGKKTPGPRGPAAFDPKTPTIVQPYKRLVDEGFITELSVVFTPTGVTITGKPDKRVADVPDSGLTVGEATALGRILTAADKGNLIPKRSGDRRKKANAAAAAPLPEKSLVKRDFEGSDQELLARARAVASSAGGPALVSRVRSAGNFGGRVTTSFQNWWAAATPPQRMASLVVPSRRGELDAGDAARFENMQCPFRGTADFIVAGGATEPTQTRRPAVPTGPPRSPAHEQDSGEESDA